MIKINGLEDLDKELLYKGMVGQKYNQYPNTVHAFTLNSLTLESLKTGWTGPTQYEMACSSIHYNDTTQNILTITPFVSIRKEDSSLLNAILNLEFFFQQAEQGFGNIDVLPNHVCKAFLVNNIIFLASFGQPQNIF